MIQYLSKWTSHTSLVAFHKIRYFCHIALFGLSSILLVATTVVLAYSMKMYYGSFLHAIPELITVALVNMIILFFAYLPSNEYMGKTKSLSNLFFQSPDFANDDHSKKKTLRCLWSQVYANSASGSPLVRLPLPRNLWRSHLPSSVYARSHEYLRESCSTSLSRLVPLTLYSFGMAAANRESTLFAEVTSVSLSLHGSVG